MIYFTHEPFSHDPCFSGNYRCLCGNTRKKCGLFSVNIYRDRDHHTAAPGFFASPVGAIEATSPRTALFPVTIDVILTS